MSTVTRPAQAFAEQLLGRIDAVLSDADAQTKPVELDPYRGQLFEVFVTADGAGFTRDESDPDLTADGLCRALAQRWGLTDAARASVERQAKLPPQQLHKMRLLWSLMRLWMEWTYAWQRWPEFHREAEPDESPK